MKTRYRVVAAAGLAALASTVVVPIAAAEWTPTADEVVAAKTCAAAAERSSTAFSAVRDDLRAGGGNAEGLLSAAEGALADARTACSHDPDVSASLAELDSAAAGIRQALAGQ